jgi:uncharacterized membrane protein YgcG
VATTLAVERSPSSAVSAPATRYSAGRIASSVTHVLVVLVVIALVVLIVRKLFISRPAARPNPVSSPMPPENLNDDGDIERVIATVWSNARNQSAWGNSGGSLPSWSTARSSGSSWSSGSSSRSSSSSSSSRSSGGSRRSFGGGASGSW